MSSPGDRTQEHHHPPLWALALAFAVGCARGGAEPDQRAARDRGAGRPARRGHLLRQRAGARARHLAVAARARARRCCTACPRSSGPDGLRWWHLLGGLLGATFVAGQGLVVPLLGVALFTVLAVAGNTTSSMLTDRAGIGPGRSASGDRAPRGRRDRHGARRRARRVGPARPAATSCCGRCSLALLAGAGTGVQPALNGQVAARTGEPLVATVGNFVVGTAGLLVALGIEHALGHAWRTPPAPWESPVLWLGGAIGVAFILSAAIVVRPLGVLLLSLLSTGGPAHRLARVGPARPDPGHGGRPGSWSPACCSPGAPWPSRRTAPARRPQRPEAAPYAGTACRPARVVARCGHGAVPSRAAQRRAAGCTRSTTRTLASFVDNLDAVNAVADASPGFVWRLQEESGNATDVRPWGDDMIVNLSRVGRPGRRCAPTSSAPTTRRCCVAVASTSTRCDAEPRGLWWVPAGHRPELDEARERLDHLDGTARRRTPSRCARPSRRRRPDLLIDPSDAVSAGRPPPRRRAPHRSRS